MKTLSVLLVDDSEAFANSATQFLPRDQRLQVVGWAETGEDALAQVALLRPDLVLMDVAMPTRTGLEATRLLKTLDHPPQVVIVALHDLPEYRKAAAEVSADGYVPKCRFGTDLAPLIDRLLTPPENTTHVAF